MIWLPDQTWPMLKLSMIHLRSHDPPLVPGCRRLTAAGDWGFAAAGLSFSSGLPKQNIQAKRTLFMGNRSGSKWIHSNISTCVCGCKQLRSPVKSGVYKIRNKFMRAQLWEIPWRMPSDKSWKPMGWLVIAYCKDSCCLLLSLLRCELCCSIVGVLIKQPWPCVGLCFIARDAYCTSSWCVEPFFRLHTWPSSKNSKRSLLAITRSQSFGALLATWHPRVENCRSLGRDLFIAHCPICNTFEWWIASYVLFVHVFFF